MSISYIPDQNTYKEMTPFKRFVLQSFPWIDANFDALTNYELMGKIIEYLNTIISNENAVQSNGGYVMYKLADDGGEWVFTKEGEFDDFGQDLQ